MKLVLYEPQIPQNTGNILRSCSVTGTDLVLVEPLGFSLSDRQLKRAGLDYFEGVNVEVIQDLHGWLEKQTAPFTFFSRHAKRSYTSIPYAEDHILLFGAETHGLAASFWETYPENFACIPVRQEARCLNLATSCGIVLFHALHTAGSLEQANTLV